MLTGASLKQSIGGKLRIKVALILGATLALCGALQAATTYTYEFGGLGGDLGSSTHAFAPTNGPGPNITAHGFKPGFASNVFAVDLYSKGNPGDESGLGLTNDPSHENEITVGSFVMLDMGSLSIATLSTESTTNGEKWEIWGSNTAAIANSSYTIPSSNGIGVLTGTSEGDQNVSSLKGDRYIFVTALDYYSGDRKITDGNILICGVTATDAPEPASAGLLGLALLTSGFLFRSRFSKKAQKA